MAAEYRDIFGAGNYWIELQDHGLAEQARVTPRQVALARELGIGLVATNDLHYTTAADAKPHDVLLCIQQQKLQSDPKRLRFDSEEFYLKSAEQMRALFAELPEACDNTLAIAESVDLELIYGDAAAPEDRYHLPRFEVAGRTDARGVPAGADPRRRGRALRRSAPRGDRGPARLRDRA